MIPLFLVFVCAVSAIPHHHHRRGPQPCEIPTYLEELPVEAREKVKAIWKDYKEGDKCYNEQGLTREVIFALPKDKRKEIFKQFHGLPFLKNVSADIQKQFKAIMKDRAISRNEKPEKLKELAEKVLKGDELKKFNKFYDKMVEQLNEFKEKVEKLSPDAKKAYEKVEKVEEEKRKVFEGLSDETKEELIELFKDRPHFGFFRP